MNDQKDKIFKMPNTTRENKINFTNKNLKINNNPSIAISNKYLTLKKIINKNKNFKSTNLEKFEKTKKYIYLNIKNNLKKYDSNIRKIDIKTINDIIYDERKHIVSQFKDFLFWDENSDFLKRFYDMNESTDRIPRISAYYQNYTMIKPIYFKLDCYKFLYKNFKRHKKRLEILEEKLNNNLINDNENNEIKNTQKEFYFNKSNDYSKLVKSEYIKTETITEINTNFNCNKIKNNETDEINKFNYFDVNEFKLKNKENNSSKNNHSLCKGIKDDPENDSYLINVKYDLLNNEKNNFIDDILYTKQLNLEKKSHKNEYKDFFKKDKHFSDSFLELEKLLILNDEVSVLECTTKNGSKNGLNEDIINTELNNFKLEISELNNFEEKILNKKNYNEYNINNINYSIKDKIDKNSNINKKEINFENFTCENENLLFSDEFSIIDQNLNKNYLKDKGNTQNFINCVEEIEDLSFINNTILDNRETNIIINKEIVVNDNNYKKFIFEKNNFLIHNNEDAHDKEYYKNNLRKNFSKKENQNLIFDTKKYDLKIINNNIYKCNQNSNNIFENKTSRNFNSNKINLNKINNTPTQDNQRNPDTLKKEFNSLFNNLKNNNEKDKNKKKSKDKNINSENFKIQEYCIENNSNVSLINKLKNTSSNTEKENENKNNFKIIENMIKSIKTNNIDNLLKIINSKSKKLDKPLTSREKDSGDIQILQNLYSRNLHKNKSIDKCLNNNLENNSLKKNYLKNNKKDSNLNKLNTLSEPNLEKINKCNSNSKVKKISLLVNREKKSNENTLNNNTKNPSSVYNINLNLNLNLNVKMDKTKDLENILPRNNNRFNSVKNQTISPNITNKIINKDILNNFKENFKIKDLMLYQKGSLTDRQRNEYINLEEFQINKNNKNINEKEQNYIYTESNRKKERIVLLNKLNPSRKLSANNELTNKFTKKINKEKENFNNQYLTGEKSKLNNKNHNKINYEEKFNAENYKHLVDVKAKIKNDINNILNNNMNKKNPVKINNLIYTTDKGFNSNINNKKIENLNNKKFFDEENKKPKLNNCNLNIPGNFTCRNQIKKTFLIPTRNNADTETKNPEIKIKHTTEKNLNNFNFKNKLNSGNSANKNINSEKEYHTNETNNINIFENSNKIDNFKNNTSLINLTSITHSQYHNNIDLNPSNVESCLKIFKNSECKFNTVSRNANIKNFILTNDSSSLKKQDFITFKNNNKNYNSLNPKNLVSNINLNNKNITNHHEHTGLNLKYPNNPYVTESIIKSKNLQPDNLNCLNSATNLKNNLGSNIITNSYTQRNKLNSYADINQKNYEKNKLNKSPLISENANDIIIKTKSPNVNSVDFTKKSIEFNTMNTTLIKNFNSNNNIENNKIKEENSNKKNDLINITKKSNIQLNTKTGGIIIPMLNLKDINKINENYDEIKDNNKNLSSTRNSLICNKNKQLNFEQVKENEYLTMREMEILNFDLDNKGNLNLIIVEGINKKKDSKNNINKLLQNPICKKESANFDYKNVNLQIKNKNKLKNNKENKINTENILFKDINTLFLKKK